MDSATIARSPSHFSAWSAWMRSHPYTVLTVILLLGLAIPFFHRPHEDSEWEMVYVAGANRLVAGEDLYNGTEGYFYPPFAAFCAIPFTYLPGVWCRLAWYAVNALALVCLCGWAWKVSGGGLLEGPRASRADQIILWAGLACGFRYVLDGLAHQQTDVVLGAWLLGGCLALLRDRPMLAATLFGLAAGIKCTPLLWCGYLLWRGYWPAALWLVAVAGGVNLLPNLVSAPGDGGWWLGQWLNQYLLPTQASSRYVGIWGSAVVYNQSLAGALFRFLVTDYTWTGAGFTVIDKVQPPSPETVRRLLYGLELGLAALLAWAVGRPGRLQAALPADLRPSRQSVEFSVVLLLMLLLSPMSSKPHFCTLLLPGFCLARLAIAEKRLISGVFVGAAVVAGFLSIKDVWGGNFAALALWWGSVSASALLLLLGCAHGLLICRGVGASRN
jgi:hypothetical protein